MSGRGSPDAVAGRRTASQAGITKGSTPSIAFDDAAGKPSPKWMRTLRCLLIRPMTSFELEKRAHDHCANSTVSDLKRKGLIITSELVEVAGYAGESAWIARYTLAPESRERALKLLGTP